MVAQQQGKFTVGDYLAERLAQVGVRHHFVVPGDYNLILLDKLQAHPDLKEVGCANELNCSLAAEGYARANGISACVVTYSVGALSAFNGTGSAYAENLPLVLISGSPNTNDPSQYHILHHTLGHPDYTYQYEMAKKITCCAVAIPRAIDAPRLIDRALRAAILARKPCYIEIPTNLAGATCVRPGPISAITDPITSDKSALEAAAKCAAEYLDGKLKPVILVGPKAGRAGSEKELIEFAEAMGCAVALQPAAKGMFPEDHKQFVGIFWGQVSSDAADAMVHWADAMICVGAVFNDYSTVGWTAVPNIPLMTVDMDHVTFPGAHFSRVRMCEFLSHLATQVTFNDSTMIEYKRLKPDPPHVHTAEREEPLSRKEISRQVQEMLTDKTSLFVDTGDSWFNGIQLKLPPGAKFEIEMQWGHIGWSIPAAFGYALRHPDRHTIVLVGDGSFQVTAQEVSQMVRFKVPITIMLINNRGYTIEVEIHDGSYNKIKNWDYAMLVEAFNSTDGHAKGLLANTAGELADAIKVAESHKEGPTLIECTIDQDDCSMLK
ncbi:pyruvate decarboxylase, variant [Neurospora crassa OR74A]|uniref:Pyruvate decarboxylase n=1 Tax=Neurospora crassa (strain ATCC 24698 / 74-OR23-1A / CBS 708.71 / DSM 1257 / FGSC 987) TaxID=367110 RepID=V5IMQ6_NEUCR|nr:pyruvate decarboxylase, variant [Neurospora crassa OR74A]ESA42031.1 pyruvate decarboxylase, variant [Neurospora crassa OR74A]|eukprot:XP_011395110.1 pyruvate decarboxylase, variant [Neurospora crassa OR74A]